MSSVSAMQQVAESHELFRLINNTNSPAGDIFFGIVSGLGDGLIIALICSLLMLFRLRLGIAALLAFIVSGLFVQILKRIFDMPRPPAVLENVHVLGTSLMSHSFPSGHSTSDGVMVLAAFLLWCIKDWRSWLAGIVFLLAAFGRIYGGVHFPIDVAAGMTIGIATMWMCWKGLRSLPVEQWEVSPWAWKIPGLIAAIQAAVLGLGYRVQPSTAQPLSLIIPVAALVILMQVWKRKLAHES
jgi:membrane-associated phospholipid phosphatase